MKRLIRIALDFPRATLAMVALCTLGLGAGALRLELHTDGEALYPRGNPVVERSLLDRQRFRDPPLALLLVQARAAAEPLTSPAGLRFLRALHQQLQGLAVLRPSGLVSIASLPRLDPGGGGLSIGTYLDEIPEDSASLAQLLDELRGRALTDGLLLSRDGRRAVYSLPVSETVSGLEAIRTLERFCVEADSPDYELLLGGPLVAESLLGDRVLWDLAVLVPSMLVLIALLLYTMLRSPGGVWIPLVETGVVLAWTFGAMGWVGAPVALVTTILPVVLMAMCITDEIHLLERLLAHWHAGDMRVRTRAALEDVARPIVATSVTTALGFLSFTSASIGPLREFGLFAAFGIMTALLLSFSMIPALIVLQPERAFRPRGGSALGFGLRGPGELAARAPGRCFALGALALLVLLPGIGLLRVSDSWVENFDPSSPLVRADRAINESFWGTYRFDVVAEARPGYFQDPDGAALVERLVRSGLSAPHVGGATSYLTPLREIASVLDEKRPLSELPRDKLWDLFTLADMSQSRSGLRELISDRGDTARLRFYVRSPDYERAVALERHLRAALIPLAEGTPASLHFSGDLPVATALVESIVTNQLRSIGWALATIAAALLLLRRRLSALLALVPAATATVGLLGFMGLSGLELGIATSMFASLALGVGVDFGIHFVHRYERESASGLAHADAIRATTAKAGRALFWNACVLAGGFAVLAASSLRPNHSLGLLLSAATLACYAGSLLLLPWLLKGGSRAVNPMLVCTLLCLAPAAHAQSVDCSRPEEAGAREFMARVERSSRSGARITRTKIETMYERGIFAEPEHRPEPKIIWSLANGNVEQTRQLFVFSGPGRMAGTTLLLHDALDPGGVDSMWFYLRAFDHFEKLRDGSERVVVPGTALSYEDARGFISVSRYRFHRVSGETEFRRIAACPRSRAIAHALGYSALVIDVDDALLVRRADYRGPGGGPLKLYELLESTRFGAQTLPARVRIRQRVDGYDNLLAYEYWAPSGPLPKQPFAPSRGDSSFLERLRTVLEANGLGERIAAELDRADARVRRYEERKRALGKPKPSDARSADLPESSR